MPYRMVDDGYWADPDLELPHLPSYMRLVVRIGYQALWTMADDAGVVPASLSALWKSAFLWEPELRRPVAVGDFATDSPMQLIIDTLMSVGKVVPFEAEGRPFWWLKNLLKNQKMKRDLRFLHPPPPEAIVRAHLTTSNAAAFLQDLVTRRRSHTGDNDAADKSAKASKPSAPPAIPSNRRATSREIARPDPVQSSPSSSPCPNQNLSLPTLPPESPAPDSPSGGPPEPPGEREVPVHTRENEDESQAGLTGEPPILQALPQQVIDMFEALCRKPKAGDKKQLREYCVEFGPEEVLAVIGDCAPEARSASYYRLQLDSRKAAKAQPVAVAANGRNYLQAELNGKTTRPPTSSSQQRCNAAAQAIELAGQTGQPIDRAPELITFIAAMDGKMRRQFNDRVDQLLNDRYGGSTAPRVRQKREDEVAREMLKEQAASLVSS